MKNKLINLLTNILNNNQISFESIELEVPKNKENGDYSTNIALKLAKTLHKSPMEIATSIQEQIDLTSNQFITKVEIANPGFINFYLDKSYLLSIINEVIASGADYGRSNIGQGNNYNIEFVSANPTGILHLGNARGGAYGDSLARILRFSGYNVTEEYYVNDAGNQINNLALSIEARYKTICGIDTPLPENGYHGNEIITIAENLYKEYQNTLLDKPLDYFKDLGTNILLDKIKNVLKEYRINYDIYTSEKDIYKKHPLNEIINKLQDNGYTYELDGAIWLKATELGDTKDHVLVKADGSYTYLVPDIAYHIDKIERNYTHLIDVFGTDHHGYVPRLKGALKALGYNESILDVKLLQLVRLIKDGEEVKMSKRTGKIVSLQELIDLVGINATRYFFVSRSLDTQMDFDLDLALKTSNDNPVYYISYAYARICSILNTVDKIETIDNYHTLNSKEAYNVLEMLEKFPSVVTSSATKELPHLISNYVYDLASTFHTYYAKHRIITENEEETNEQLNLILAVKITLANALNLIGIIPPEKM